MSTTSNTTAKSVVYEGPERPTRPETWDLGVPRVRANTLRLMLDHLRERYGDDVLSLACLDCGSEDCRDPGHDQARETVGDHLGPAYDQLGALEVLASATHFCARNLGDDGYLHDPIESWHWACAEWDKQRWRLCPDDPRYRSRHLRDD